MGDTLLCPSARVYRPQARETGSPKRRANQTAWRCGELNIRRKLLPMYPVQTVTHLSAGHGPRSGRKANCLAFRMTNVRQADEGQRKRSEIVTRERFRSSQKFAPPLI